MDRVEVTATELLDALREATAHGASPENAITVTEMCERWGMSRQKAQRSLRAAMAGGKVECVQKPIIDISGRKTFVPAYRLRAT